MYCHVLDAPSVPTLESNPWSCLELDYQRPQELKSLSASDARDAYQLSETLQYENLWNLGYNRSRWFNARHLTRVRASGSSQTVGTSAVKNFLLAIWRDLPLADFISICACRSISGCCVCQKSPCSKTTRESSPLNLCGSTIIFNLQAAQPVTLLLSKAFYLSSFRVNA